MFRKLLMCCPLVIEGLHNVVPDSALLRAHGSLNMSSVWLICGSKEELALTQECGPVKALAFCCRRYSRHAGVASSAYVYHRWRGFGRLALFIC